MTTKPTISMVGSSHVDSLDAVEIIMELEDEFDVEIPDEDAEGFNSIEDIVNYTPNKMVERDIKYAISNSLGFGGHNASLLFKNMNK